MAEDERPAPDSLSGKLRELTGRHDDPAENATEGDPALSRDTGQHEPTGAADPPPAPARRPTDPPF